MAEYNVRQELLWNRCESAKQICARLLHLKLPFSALLFLVQVVVIPNAIFGLYSKLPHHQALEGLQSTIRSLLWPHRRHASWHAACIGIYPVHRTDPFSAAVFNHIMGIVRALRASQDVRDIWLQLDGQPPPRSARGPHSTAVLLLRQIGVTIRESWVLHADTGDDVHLLESELPSVQHYLRERLRRRLAHLAQRTHPNLYGIDQMDWKFVQDLTSRHKQHIPNATVSLLIDGVWTGRRYSHMGSPDEETAEQWSTCVHCEEGATDDIQHLLWDCPCWRQLRSSLLAYTDEIQSLPASSRLCGWKPLVASPALLSNWHVVLDSMSNIVAAYQNSKVHTKFPRSSQFSRPSQNSFVVENIPQYLDHGLRSGVCRVSDERGDAHCAAFQYEFGQFFNWSYPTSLFDTWPYGRPIFNRMAHFLSTAMITKGTKGLYQTTLLEIYCDYILWNAGERIASLQDSRHGGHHWSSQLYTFQHALEQAAKLMTLQPAPTFDSRKCKLAILMRVPTLVHCKVQFCLRYPTEVMSMISTLAQDIAVQRFNNTLADHADTWRHATLGKEDSQLRIWKGDGRDFPPLLQTVQRMRAKVPAAVYD
eukprot:6491924-Amphidinium_carterae.1